MRVCIQRYFRMRLSKCRHVQIDSTAKVNYRGIRWHPNAELRIGERTIISGQIVSERDNVRVSIGKNTFIGNSHIFAAEEISVGDDVLIAWGVYLVDHNSHSVRFSGRRDDVDNWYNGTKNWAHVEVKPIRVMRRAWIGFNSIILKGITVGEGAVVGAGSVVTKDVPPYTVVAGNPARVIKELPPEEEEIR